MKLYMKIYENENEMLDLEMIDLDGNSLFIEYVKGFGQKDINFLGYYLTWEEIDKVKEALAFAERRWRK